MNENTKTQSCETVKIDGKQEREYIKMLEEADKVVLKCVAAATAVGAVTIPIPFDPSAFIKAQVEMMMSINTIFKIDIGKNALKSLVTATLGVSGGTLIRIIRKTVAKLLKIIPRWALFQARMQMFNAHVNLMFEQRLVTLALGRAYIQVCKAIKMGKLRQDDLAKKAGTDLLKSEFEEQLKKNKDAKFDAASS